MQGLLNQSKFDIFDLSDALLNGHTTQAIKVLNKASFGPDVLRSEHDETNNQQARHATYADAMR